MLKTQVENLKKYLPMLKQFVNRDFKVKYRRSVLGILWSVLNPLGTMLIMTVVFSTVFRQDIENFPVYLMSGQLIFNFFNEASNMAMNSIINNSALIKKVYIPKYLLPVSSVCSSLVNLMTSLIALLIVIIITRTPVTWTLFFIIIPIFYTCIFALGLGMILCVIVTSFRDIQHLYSVLTTAWMYLTPIFYPISILPQEAAIIVKLNPLTQFIEMTRDIIMYHTLPSLRVHLYSIIVCGLVLSIGLLIFKKKQDQFILKL